MYVCLNVCSYNYITIQVNLYRHSTRVHKRSMYINRVIEIYMNTFFLQISDIVVGQEDVSAKEALLRWAQKTTHRYPGVKVEDFTKSWRDGLAFNAIIHRNRPDLVEWKKLDRRAVRERIDLAFHVMEREYGVTRLLDPEGKI